MSSESVDPSALERLHALGGAEFVNEMLDLALRNITEQLAHGRAAALTDDAKGVAIALHSIAGSAGNIGAVELEQLARRGLAQADRAESGSLKEDVVQLEAAFARAEALLREAQRGGP